MIMNIPWATTLVTTNEILKRWMFKKEEQHSFFTHYVCAGLAGNLNK